MILFVSFFLFAILTFKISFIEVGSQEIAFLIPKIAV